MVGSILRASQIVLFAANGGLQALPIRPGHFLRVFVIGVGDDDLRIDRREIEESLFAGL
jgi:hypothetical protein